MFIDGTIKTSPTADGATKVLKMDKQVILCPPNGPFGRSVIKDEKC